MSFTAWRRAPEAGACDFCLMLATRGAVYKTQRTAGDGNKYHRRCRCRAELETDFDRREDIRIAPEDANRQIGFRGGSHDYAYDMSDYRNLGVTDPPRVPTPAPVRVVRPGDIAKRAKVGRDVKVVRDGDLPTVDPSYANKLRRLESAASQSDDAAARWADEIARIRKKISDMEAARAKAIASRPKFNPGNPLEFYGDLLSVKGNSYARLKQELLDLESMPREMHEALRDWFLGSRHGGVYLGDVDGVPKLDDLGRLAGVHPRGWPDGQTWDQVLGVCDPTERVVAVAVKGRGSSASPILHEMAHGYDDVLARRRGFNKVWSEAAQSGAQPYFSQAGNPTGWVSEGWAESLAAYVKAGESGVSRAALISDSTGIDRAAAQKVADYFDEMFSQGSQAS